MEHNTENFPPKRITDLVASKSKGMDVICKADFEVIPVDFLHSNTPYQAYVFLSRYAGLIDGQPFSFRKCYARGCPQNLCPHVSQAVMIANRYLERDYVRLQNAGIEIEEAYFKLDEMMVKFNGHKDHYGPAHTIDEYIQMAKKGIKVSVKVNLEYLPAVENFANHKNKQTFLNCTFQVSCKSEVFPVQRCLSCYPTLQEKEEKHAAVHVANKRLILIYQAFDDSGVKYDKMFF